MDPSKSKRFKPLDSIRNNLFLISYSYGGYDALGQGNKDFNSTNYAAGNVAGKTGGAGTGSNSANTNKGTKKCFV